MEGTKEQKNEFESILEGLETAHGMRENYDEMKLLLARLKTAITMIEVKKEIKLPNWLPKQDDKITYIDKINGTGNIKK